MQKLNCKLKNFRSANFLLLNNIVKLKYLFGVHYKKSWDNSTIKQQTFNEL